MNIYLVKRSIFILCMLFSSSVLSAGLFHPTATPEYLTLARQIRSSAAKKIAKKHGMRICGMGGALMYNVKELGVAFQIHRILSEEEARILIVDCIGMLLDEVNNNESVRPYLINFPFTAENVDIEIYIRDKDNSELYDPLISVVSTFEGRIKYATHSPEKVRYENVYRETYEEALAILGKN